MKKRYWLCIAAILAGIFGVSGSPAQGQTGPQANLPKFIQQAQTVHISMMAVRRENGTPVESLTDSDLSLSIDGKPRPFQLSRPWADPGQDRPNLLIILPLGDPLDRKQVLDQTIADLSKQPQLNWNISILDDSGDQTPYTRDLKTTIAQLRKIENKYPAEMSIEDWRGTATLAINNMRNLDGRRVVMSLGDIFHEMLFDQGELAFEAFQIKDVVAAARNAGAVIYVADSVNEIDRLRRLAPYYSLVGAGPWLLLTQQGQIAGWISGSVSDTIGEIRRDAMGAYEIDLHLELEQMDGQPHVVSVTPRQSGIILDVPHYYIAPRLAQVEELSRVSPSLRYALKNPPAAGSSPLQMATQLAYFPHRDGKSGTQIATIGFFWTQATPPPAQLETALQLQQTSSGYMLNTTVGRLQWYSAQPVWNTAIDLTPGAYLLRVAAADATGKITAAADTAFSVEPATDDAVMISSLVLGKTCVFAPLTPEDAVTPKAADYLRAGNCDLAPDPTHRYSPQDVVWTLVRITPLGKLADRPSKDWKASFVLIDAAGQKLAEEPVSWLTAEDGSFVATTAFSLGNPKLKLENGQYAVVFRLKGPGVERDYGEDASFMLYGETQKPLHAR